MTKPGKIAPDLQRRLRTADRRARAAERRASEEQAALRAVIVEAIADGGSLRAVATVIGRSHAAVAKWLKEEKNSE